MNVIEEIIEVFTVEGDLVVDPFAGSGTTLFASAKIGRRAFGSDLSNLSNFLVNALLEAMEGGQELLTELDRIITTVRESSRDWFEVSPQVDLERIRYRVSGQFENGAFSLEPSEVVVKDAVDSNSWKKRRILPLEAAEVQEFLNRDLSSIPYMHSPIDFSSIALQKNSRIAIPEGALLSHFFDPANQATINLYVDTARRSPLIERFPHAVMLVLSASLPMLRLSDKKASSQWPFWRPKTALTSRNPNIVFRKKFTSMLDLITWSSSELPPRAIDSLRMKKIAAQELTPNEVGERAKLVLTDPPYGDQVPYLEYSNLWNPILGIELNDADYAQELVKSDAGFQVKNSQAYRSKLSAALKANLQLLDPADGVLVWFYQDHDLANWQTIHDTVKNEGFVVADVIALPKQRRSLKTVTSPRRTLDGDLLVIVVPADSGYARTQAEELRRRLEVLTSRDDFYAAYSRFVHRSLIEGTICDYAARFKTVSEAMRKEGLA